MSESQVQSGRGEEEENDEEHDVLYAGKNLRISSDINKKLFEKETWTTKKVIQKSLTKKPNVNPGSVDVSVSNAIDMIDTFDRPGDAYTEDFYARTGTYADTPENKPGKRIPKAGAFAEAGVGRARAEFSIFEAEAKGPNASARADANVVGVGAIARAEIAGASAKAGPFALKVGLGIDTGVSASLVDGVEVKFLGTGIKIGPRTSISLLGSEVSCAVM